VLVRMERLTRPRVTESSNTKTHTPLACRVPGPFHDSCTACIVEVARGTSATISDSTVEHLADSFQGLPDAYAIGKNLTPKSKVRSTRLRVLHHYPPPPHANSFILGTAAINNNPERSLDVMSVCIPPGQHAG
jgi:hypothetical protein